MVYFGNRGENLSPVHPYDNTFVGDIKHDLQYVGKHLLKGDFLQQELKDTEWNVTHLFSSGGYHILHGLGVLFCIYLAVGSVLKYYVQGVRGFPEVLPHVEFWREYPTLVLEGFAAVKLAILAKSDTVPSGDTFSGCSNVLERTKASFNPKNFSSEAYNLVGKTDYLYPGEEAIPNLTKGGPAGHGAMMRDSFNNFEEWQL